MSCPDRDAFGTGTYQFLKIIPTCPDESFSSGQVEGSSYEDLWMDWKLDGGRLSNGDSPQPTAGVVRHSEGPYAPFSGV